MIYPSAVWRPGVNAGYRAGRASMTTAVCHTTVGRNSLPIMDRGYFNFLVARDGTIYQGAEADAITWHAGNWNPRGPGIEVEYLDEDTIFTPEAYAATAGLVEWLIGLGIPDDFYDGPRVATHRGFITHRSLIQTGDAHSDYWPELPKDADMPFSQDDLHYLQNYVTGMGIDGVTPITNLDLLKAIGAIKPSAGGGLTEEQVRAIVRSELNKTKLGPA